MLLSTLDMLPSTLDIVPSTLDPRQLDTLPIITLVLGLRDWRLYYFLAESI